jgi:hypothetical protein
MLFPFANIPHNNFFFFLIVYIRLQSKVLCCNVSVRKKYYPIENWNLHQEYDCHHMVEMRIILYLCIFGIQIEQNKKKFKKTKNSNYFSLFFIFFLSIIQEQERGKKHECIIHPSTHTHTHARASRRIKRDIVRSQQSNNPRIAIIISLSQSFRFFCYTHNESRRPSLFIVYRL